MAMSEVVVAGSVVVTAMATVGVFWVTRSYVGFTKQMWLARIIHERPK